MGEHKFTLGVRSMRRSNYFYNVFEEKMRLVKKLSHFDLFRDFESILME